jgi:pilus assembly protein CpaB
MKAARLVVLGIAVAAGGLAAILAGGSGDKSVEAPAPAAKLDLVDILVAKSDIGIGHTVSDQDIAWQAWPTTAAGPNFIRKTDRPDAIGELVGSIARGPFVIGEPIRDAKLIKGKGSGYMAAILPSGMRAVSTEISPETGAGGFILPNDYVDVILSRRDRAAEKTTGVEVHISETILTNVRVLAIDQTVEDKGGQKVVIGKTATLELAPQQAETLALSRQLGTLSLALRSLVDANQTAEAPADDKGDRRRINTIRYGVTTVTTPR